MIDHAVVIAGGGPTGLMLAGELALAGVDVAIVERRATSEVIGSRAGGLHARTLELFDQRGIADRFLAEGQKAQVIGFAGKALDMSDFPTRFPFSLGLRQSRIEPIMADWVGELGVPIYRGREVTGFASNDEGVVVALSDGSSLRAAYLVGCDGGRSLVRRLAGIDFPGEDATVSNIIANVELAETPEWGIRHDEAGIHSLGRLDYRIVDGRIVYAETRPVGVLVTEREVKTGEPTLEQLKAGMIAAFGSDYGVHSPTWLSRFTDATRQAASYRQGRVLLAGDAAHIHYPAGGQGLNIGVHDAVNLGWKLAQVVKGTAPEGLLDSYHADRHPADARVLQATMAAGMLQRPGARIKAVRSAMADLLGIDEARKRFAGMLSGLDLRYDLGEGHPLLGRRMPDLDLVTTAGTVRVFSLLHRARPVLIRLGSASGSDLTPWAGRLELVAANYDGSWELPVVGEVRAPSAVLVRPDGHVAWVGEGADDGLGEALARWFGPAS
ncbi:MAG TPA: FAD-dependent monooxygenase [Devosia sp.]|nr:FAD-dependent monooxygenase [Devosia sp.]